MWSQTKYKKINLNKTQSRKERLYKPYCWDKYDMKEIKKEQRQLLVEKAGKRERVLCFLSFLKIEEKFQNTEILIEITARDRKN